MSTLSMPKVAAELNNRPFFAVRSLVDGGTSWWHRPALPDRTWTWADDSDVRADHITLDTATLAELLFCTALQPADQPTPRDIRSAVTIQLGRCHCDVSTCVAALAQEAGDHPDAYVARIAWCRALAEQLLGGAA